MLHLHDDILGLPLRIDSFVKDLDDSHRWQFARCLTDAENGRLFEGVLIGGDFDVDPVLLVVDVRIACDAHPLHQE